MKIENKINGNERKRGDRRNIKIYIYLVIFVYTNLYNNYLGVDDMRYGKRIYKHIYIYNCVVYLL